MLSPSIFINTGKFGQGTLFKWNMYAFYFNYLLYNQKQYTGKGISLSLSPEATYESIRVYKMLL